MFPAVHPYVVLTRRPDSSRSRASGPPDGAIRVLNVEALRGRHTADWRDHGQTRAGWESSRRGPSRVCTRRPHRKGPGSLYPLEQRIESGVPEMPRMAGRWSVVSPVGDGSIRLDGVGQHARNAGLTAESATQAHPRPRTRWRFGSDHLRLAAGSAGFRQPWQTHVSKPGVP